MKKLVFILGIALLCSFTISSTSICKQQQSVWICSSSTTYHKSASCIDMKNCTGTKKHVTVSEATTQGKTACGVCFPAKNTTPQGQKKQATKRTKTQSDQTAPASDTQQQPKKQATKRVKQ
ncbi:MAG: hypothetical protein IK117_04775 [Bacteroidales bacterium]|nr:hypothetical protein [Bacteroidales bacterium]